MSPIESEQHSENLCLNKQDQLLTWIKIKEKNAACSKKLSAGDIRMPDALIKLTHSRSQGAESTETWGKDISIKEQDVVQQVPNTPCSAIPF